MKFKTGEVVRHKTIGDQGMVVLKFYEPDSYDCRYYNVVTGEYVTKDFYEYELEKAS